MRKRKNAAFEVPPVVLIEHTLLNTAPYNPNEMTVEERAALRESIKINGFVENLVVQKWSELYKLKNVLIGGHQRLGEGRALRVEAGDDSPFLVPCVVLDVNDDEAMALNAALNKIRGVPDPLKLGQLFARIAPRLTESKTLATGYTREEIDRLISATRPSTPPERPPSGFASSVTMSIEFDTVADRDAAKGLLQVIAEERGKKVGRIVLELLREAGKNKPRKKKAA